MKGTVHIDNGSALAAKLEISREQITQHTNTGRPDLRWTHLDKASHWHAYDRDGTLPTLRAQEAPRPCDGSCGGVCQGEGYSVTIHHCRICDEQIEPGWEAGPHTIVLPGLTEWWIDLDRVQATDDTMTWYRRSREQMTARFHGVDKVVRFGIVLVTDLAMHGTHDGTTVTARLHGAGPLGVRP